MTAGPSNSPASTFTPLTSSQPAAIGVVRVAGPAFESFARTHVRFASASTLARLSAGDVRRAELCDTDGEPIDDILVSVRSAAPNWEVWLHLHGGPWIARRCGELLAAAGIVEAPPRGDSIFPTATPIDAAVAERLPAMLTFAGVRWLMRQAELLPRCVARLAAAVDRHPHLVCRACANLATSIRVFDWYSRPLRIALIGPPNAGKSTLFNRLVGESASITSPTPGTTRDWVEAPGEMAGFPVMWIDTAGVFEASNSLDAAGVAATATASLTADLRVAVLDATTIVNDLEAPKLPAWLKNPNATVINKSDSVQSANLSVALIKRTRIGAIHPVSALTGDGISVFLHALLGSTGRIVRLATRPAVFTDSQAAQAASAARAIDRKSLKELVLRIDA